MKNAKKILSVMLAIVTIFAMAVPVMATEAMQGNGSITVTGANKGETYNAYRIFDLESFVDDNTDDDTDGAYAYRATEKWLTFVDAQAATYFNKEETTDGKFYYTWKDGADAATFAALADAYATENSIEPDKSIIVTSGDVDADDRGQNETIVFSDMPLGYYLIDTTVGTLCILDTTNTDITVADKNVDPTIKKEVQEDNGEAWGDYNTADYNQTVNYKITVTAQKGAENYVIHDTMDANLVLQDEAEAGFVVTLNGNTLTRGTDYTVDKNPTDSHTFDITFTQSVLDGIAGEESIVVTYSATLANTADATAEGEDNDHDNVTYLAYAGGTTTASYEVSTETFDFKLHKYTEWNDGDDTTSTNLAGAYFTVKNKATGKYASFTGNYKFEGWLETAPTYTNMQDATLDAANSVVKSDANGMIHITGLDADTYTVTEIKAPDGYNLLKESFDVTIGEDGQVYEASDATGTADADQTIEVLNKSGAEMPSTGGMGTTIFYICGSALVIAAAVLLITKRLVKNAR